MTTSWSQYWLRHHAAFQLARSLSFPLAPNFRERPASHIELNWIAVFPRQRSFWPRRLQSAALAKPQGVTATRKTNLFWANKFKCLRLENANGWTSTRCPRRLYTIRSARASWWAHVRTQRRAVASTSGAEQGSSGGHWIWLQSEGWIAEVLEHEGLQWYLAKMYCLHSIRISLGDIVLT